jgi:hypothetical protein
VRGGVVESTQFFSAKGQIYFTELNISQSLQRYKSGRVPAVFTHALNLLLKLCGKYPVAL